MGSTAHGELQGILYLTDCPPENGALSHGRWSHFKSAHVHRHALNHSYDRVYLWARADGRAHF